ncbi:MAG: GyrI-like domain-containing protein [Bacteroidota bacterium]|nr:GyrI-like domain-containing protein [Bacteroidota bacterium]
MEPRIENLKEKKLIGLNVTMSLSNNKTLTLWQEFMPRKREILNGLNTNLFSIRIYRSHQDLSNIHSEFEKWAAIEVSDFDKLPNKMKALIIEEGLYAVFLYKGSSSDHSIYNYIYGTWLPNSTYLLDNRPHFEVMGEKYKNNDPDSEEEIWIPISLKR